MTLSKIKDGVFFLLGYSPASEFYISTFRNVVSSIFMGGVRTKGQPMKMEQSIPKRLHMKFRRRGITQKKEYIIQNTARV
jgi:hypothetical protein